MTLINSLPAPALRKRKSLEDEPSFEHTPVLPRVIKHPRRLENYQLDNDHTMSLPILENSSAAQEALQNPPSPSSPPDASPTFQYPLIQLYPDFPDPNAMDVDQSPPESPNQEPIGLLGLQALGDKHINCTQLPRLQIANYPGLEGRRAMFTQCMQCGGISQITNL